MCTMTIEEIRRNNLRRIAKDYDSSEALAARIGREPNQLSQLIGRTPTRNIGGRLARDIEKRLALPEGWLDQNYEDDLTPSPQNIPPFINTDNLAELLANKGKLGALSKGSPRMPGITADIAIHAKKPICVWCNTNTHYLKDHLLIVDFGNPPPTGKMGAYYFANSGEIVVGENVGMGKKVTLAFNNSRFPVLEIADNSEARLIGTVIGYLHGLPQP